MPYSNNPSDVMLHSSDGTEIFATAVGDPTNPPIVFVHGYTFSAVVFDDLFQEERLLTRYYMVAYDLRGHGRSGKPTTPEGYNSNLFADDFAAVIKHFNVKSPLYAGWSYGGTVMTDIFAHLPPQTISGIIGITAIPALELLVQNPVIANIIPLFGVSDDVSVYVNAKSAFFDACFNDPSSLPTQLKWSWLGSSVMQHPPVPLLLLTREQNTTKLFEAGKQGLPYLALITTADKLLLHDEIAKGLMPHFKNLQVHQIERGGHTPFVENKEEFMEVFIAFAEKVLKNRNSGN